MLSFAEIRAREFSRLDAQKHVYLDYTGSALYAESQIRAHHELLRTGLFGNPHSESAPSQASTEIIERARDRVLLHFDVDRTTHDVIFTANTSAAIKLVAESYPFSSRNACVLTVDNHNSMNGIREYAMRAGAAVHYLPLDDELRLRDFDLPAGGGLFGFPAQSNFSGVQHPLSLVTEAQQCGFDVMLDVAAYVPSHALSLRECPADFVALSFYKMFGYPTGVGALIARRDSLAKLHRPWFAGGTVLFASVTPPTHLLRPDHEGWEDGTPNFLAIAALEPGFDFLDSIGMPRITDHVRHLTTLLLESLHPAAQIYGPLTVDRRGGTIGFNIPGIPYWEVEAAAREQNISLRGGCFCNPGAALSALGLDPHAIAHHLTTLGPTFTPARLATTLGQPVGAVRVSVGVANGEGEVGSPDSTFFRVCPGWRSPRC